LWFFRKDIKEEGRNACVFVMYVPLDNFVDVRNIPERDFSENETEEWK